MAIIAQLMRLDGPQGVIRLSSLPFEWTDSLGAIWKPGSFLRLSARGSTSAVDGGSFTLVWSGASAALLSIAQDAGVIRSKFYMYSIFLDELTLQQIGQPFDELAGLSETPDIDSDPAAPAITLTIQSPLLDLAKSRPIRLKGAELMQDRDPGLR